jgi:hypothetical protein
MAKKKIQQQETRELTHLEKLGLRVSAMIGSPKAQLERQARIHRLDTDTEEAWYTIMELLAETDGLDLLFDDEGNVVVTWEKVNDDDQVAETEGKQDVEEGEAPF